MAAKSGIEWTESTWNPVTGCSKSSSGCLNCYAEKMSKRLKAMGQKNYAHGFNITLHPDMLDRPLKWKKPRIIFVNSMSDLFHEDIPFKFIQNVFEVMNESSWHCFQILTKRSERLCELSPRLKWSSNIWMGVTVESLPYVSRINDLRNCRAAIKFISAEPLLSSIAPLDLEGIDWVIVGGESGSGARPMNSEWVKEIQRDCNNQRVPFFFKQWGGFNKKKTGRRLDGREWNEMPADIFSARP
jgi:protein gp37